MNSSATVTGDIEARQAAWRVAPGGRPGAERGAFPSSSRSHARELASVGVRSALRDADRIAPSMPTLG